MKRFIVSLWMLGMISGLFAEDPEALGIGEKAPDFSLMGIDGQVYTLESFSKAEVLTVVFSANHCPTAQAYEGRMKDLSAAYEPGKMQMVAISSNHPQAVCLEELGYSDLGDTFDEMKIRAADESYNFPYLYDGETQEVALAYGAKATPHVFIFDAERVLRYSGRIDEMEDPYQTPKQHDARNAIEAILAGKAVPVETTRAFGCSMKWKSKAEWRKTLDEGWAEKPVELLELDLAGTRELVENKTDRLRLINVWATWCGPCIIEFPEFVEMQRMYGNRDFEVVSISMDRPEKQEKVLKFLEEKQAAFTNYLSVESDRDAFIDALDPKWQGNLPLTLLVAPGGEVIYSHDGIIDPLELKKVIVGKLGRYFASDNPDVFEKENLVAWCIVPFDANERSPEQRADMLVELGLTKMAYDYRDKHVPSFPEEFKAMKEHNIEMSAVWLWLDPMGDDILGDMGRAILQATEESGTHTEVWVSFPEEVFANLSDDEAVAKGVEILSFVLEKVESMGCTMALYNHGAWFGEPENQVKIVQAMASEKVKLVYNFHHAHLQVEQFSELLDLMLPYLSCINLNGMRVEGPKIMTLGEGDRELEMMKIIVASGYNGSIGILGHTDGEDIKPVLERNLAGLEKLREQLN